MASMMAEVFTGGKDHNACWQDREIRFDAFKADLELRKGEFIIDILVRGNPDSLQFSRSYLHCIQS